MLQKFKHQDFCNPRFILNVLDSDIVVRLHIVSITQHSTVTSSTRTLQSWGIMLCLTRILKACLPLHLIWTSWKKSSQPAGKDKEEREYRLQGPPPTLGPEASSQSKEDLGFLSSVRYWLVGQNHNSQSALFNSLMGMNPRRFSLFLSFFWRQNGPATAAPFQEGHFWKKSETSKRILRVAQHSQRRYSLCIAPPLSTTQMRGGTPRTTLRFPVTPGKGAGVPPRLFVADCQAVG